MLTRLTVIAALASASVCTPSNACSYAPATNSPSEIKEAAKEAYDQAAFIADLELVDPLWIKPKPHQCCRFARYKVIRSLKGRLPVGQLIAIPNGRPCDIAYGQKGVRFRILMEEFNGHLSMDGGLNGARYNRSMFNHEIDNLVGNDRASMTPKIY